MTIDFTKPVLQDTKNNGYMVTLKNGWPYEIIGVDPTCQWPNLWSDVQAWLAAGNTAQPYVPPPPVLPDPVAQANATLQALTPQVLNALVNSPPMQAALGSLVAQWQAAWKAAGNN